MSPAFLALFSVSALEVVIAACGGGHAVFLAAVLTVIIVLAVRGLPGICKTDDPAGVLVGAE